MSPNIKKGKRVLTNTQQQAVEQPSMRSWVMGGAPHKIEQQEAEGQCEFCMSETLPTDMRGDAKMVLEKAGVKFGKKVEGDEMFQYVELPAGWKKSPTDHSMWSDLVDDKGRVRAAIFYKAAFYDRSAQLTTRHRYGYSFDYDREKKDGVGVANVTDCGKVIHMTEPITVGDRERYEVSEEARKSAQAWLDVNFPNWQDTSAYWD